jgi:hypothetical protein
MSGEYAILTAPLIQSCLFQTGSIASPASRFFCEHLHQNLFWACISRIHAQVPLVTSGKLTESLHQQIPSGIDVSVMGCLAFRAHPKPDIQPQLIELVPAVRAGFARGIPAVHCDEDLVMCFSPRSTPTAGAQHESEGGAFSTSAQKLTKYRPAASIVRVTRSGRSTLGRGSASFKTPSYST